MRNPWETGSGRVPPGHARPLEEAPTINHGQQGRDCVRSVAYDQTEVCGTTMRNGWWPYVCALAVLEPDPEGV